MYFIISAALFLMKLV